MWLYNILISLYGLLIRIVSLWTPKARLWVDGRKGLFEKMSREIDKNEKIIWIHAASLGEFEQGRPLLEKIKRESDYRVAVTFFSPSGYEVCKNYKGADYIFYLPLDTPRAVAKLLDILNPQIAIFVKYEYWLNILFSLKKRGVPSYLVSANFRENSIFFKWWGGLFRRALASFNTIFVQSDDSKSLLATIGINNVIVAGDTRFDRVMEIANAAEPIDLIEQFRADQRVFIAGSTWAADEAILLPLMAQHPEIKFIIAPHEIHNQHIGELEELIKSYGIRYTMLSDFSLDKRPQLLIINSIGLLSRAYKYGDFAYIGGGFGVGIHNTLEAAVYGVPIAFGHNYHKFLEARQMVELQIAKSVNSTEELQAWFAPLAKDEGLRQEVKMSSESYIKSKLGATQTILDVLLPE